jgi:hypothetical protein
MQKLLESLKHPAATSMISPSMDHLRPPELCSRGRGKGKGGIDGGRLHGREVNIEVDNAGCSGNGYQELNRGGREENSVLL